MGALLAEWHLWIKALHVISVIAWMAGLLYLPRLFVYHSQVAIGSPQSDLFKVMERRLLRVIMNPAMILAYVFGGLMLGTPGLIEWGHGWIWVKLAAILVLTGMHHLFARWFKEFRDDGKRRAIRTFRIANEVPTVMMIIIVIMVIVRPF